MYKYFSAIFLFFALILLLSGCSDSQTDSQTETSASETTAYDYSKILLRQWQFSEVLNSLHFDGCDISFPFSVSSLNDTAKNNGYSLDVKSFSDTFAEGIITTPYFGAIYVTWQGNADNPLDSSKLIDTTVSSMKIGLYNGITDFSLYGMELNWEHKKIMSDFGIPDDVFGDYTTGNFEMIYNGEDNQNVTLTISDNKLSEVSITSY